jgi:hypothetical protein
MELADSSLAVSASKGYCDIIILIFKLGRFWYIYVYVSNDVLGWKQNISFIDVYVSFHSLASVLKASGM